MGRFRTAPTWSATVFSPEPLLPMTIYRDARSGIMPNHHMAAIRFPPKLTIPVKQDFRVNRLQ